MGHKKYINANHVLPIELIKEIQKYVEGAYLYVPKTKRTAWGTESGIREELDLRNEQIVDSYNNGIRIPTLAEGYCLSEERIRSIVFGYVFSPKNEKEVANMLTKDDLDQAKNIFCQCVETNGLSIQFVDVRYLKVLEEDVEETLTFYYHTTYSDTELRDASRVLVKEIAIKLNQRICIRQTRKTAI